MAAWLEPADKHRTEWRDHESSFATLLSSGISRFLTRPSQASLTFKKLPVACNSNFHFSIPSARAFLLLPLPALSDALESFRFCLIASIAVRTKWRGESQFALYVLDRLRLARVLRKPWTFPFQLFGLRNRDEKITRHNAVEKST
jgi:hypothetical protein